MLGSPGTYNVVWSDRATSHFLKNMESKAEREGEGAWCTV